MKQPTLSKDETCGSMRGLMSGLIDYAGLFPPASLSLEEAIRNYADYRQDTDSWMLSRFICPSARLEELAPVAELFHSSPPFRFSVLGTGGVDAPSFLRALESDIACVEAFIRAHSGLVSVEVMEIRFPEHLLDFGPERIVAFFEAACALLARSTVPPVSLFVEILLHDHGLGQLPIILKSIADGALGHSFGLGLKFRCGGVEEAAFPAPDRLARAMAACRDARISYKMTAGLHHPIRQFHDSVNTKMYGFLNVFGAAVMAETHLLDTETIQRILKDEDVSHFVFSGSEFTWNGLSASSAQIERARSIGAQSFGSCSFDEPREDLRSLGLL